MVADSLRWLSRPRPRLVQSRWAVNSDTVLVSAGRLSSLMAKTKGLRNKSKALMPTGNRPVLGRIDNRIGRQLSEEEIISDLKSGCFGTIIPVTHPPRLSGFDRDAQPWRVFCACRILGGTYA